MAARGGRPPRGRPPPRTGANGGGSNGGSGGGSSRYQYHKPTAPAAAASTAAPTPAAQPAALAQPEAAPATAARTTSDSARRALDLQTGWLSTATPVHVAPYIPRRAWAELPENRRVETLRQQNKDLERLLFLPHARFWPTVLQDPSVAVFVDSYARLAPRPYESVAPRLSDDDGDESDESEAAALERSLAQRVLRLVWRLVTRVESAAALLSPEGYAKHVSRSGLVSVSLLMDVSAIFCPVNARLVQSVQQRAFDLMPVFLDTECAEAFAGVVATLNRLSESLDGPEAVVRSPSWDLARLLDMHQYYEDIGWTLKQFCDVCPSSVSLKLAQTPDLLVALLKAYDGGLSALGHSFDALLRRAAPTSLAVRAAPTSLADDFAEQHQRIRLLWVALVYRLLNDRFFSRIGSKVGADLVKVTEEMYDTFLRAVEHEQENYDEFSHHMLMRDVNERFRLSRTLRELSPHGADARLDFVRMALGDVALQDGQPDRTPAVVATAGHTPEQLSLIAAVKDLLPDLGDGFVDACLQYYHGEVEAVVNAVLEDSLPPALKALDRAAPHVPVKPAAAPATPAQPSKDRGKGKAKAGTDTAPAHAAVPAADAVTSRRNVFDNGMYDLSQAMGGVHIKGKASRGKVDSHVLLSGGRPSGAERERILRTQYDEYEDEYDDTFDDEDVQTGVLRGDAGTVEVEADAFDPLRAFDAGVVAELLRARGEDPSAFDRTAQARRSQLRKRLVERLGLSDEQIEGWHMMMLRHPPKPKSLEEFQLLTEEAPGAGAQGGDDDEGDDGEQGKAAAGGRGQGRGRGGRGGGGGGQGRGRGGGQPPNRRDAQLQKMNRGMGGPLASS